MKPKPIATFSATILLALALALPSVAPAADAAPGPKGGESYDSGQEAGSAPGTAPIPVRQTAASAGIIRVNSSVQAFDFYRPWNKKQPASLRGIGAVIEGGRVLVAASIVANRTYIELEKAEDAVKCEAVVEVVDYDANLAILKPAEPAFLEGISAMPLAREVNAGDMLAVLQLESGGTLAASPGRVTSIELTRYLTSETPFLTFKLTIPLQYRDGSHCLPVVDHSGALTGLTLRYDLRSQTLETVPFPVIAHFLADAEKAPYEGFPRAGIRLAPLRDPALRAHLGAANKAGGVFVEGIVKGGAAEKAGLKVGDVLLKIGPFEIDADGNFDHPAFGELGAAHIFSTEFFVGDDIPLEILREGKAHALVLKAATRKPSDFAIPPSLIDVPPPYIVVGGLVLVELSRNYLQEWGGRWETSAPLQLVHLDRYQDDLIEPGRRVIVLSQVLPTDDTVGYEEARNVRILSVNGVTPKNLRDVAAALEKPVNGFHRFEIDADPGLIVLDAARLKSVNESVSKAYGIPALRRLE